MPSAALLSSAEQKAISLIESVRSEVVLAILASNVEDPYSGIRERTKSIIRSKMDFVASQFSDNYRAAWAEGVNSGSVSTAIIPNNFPPQIERFEEITKAAFKSLRSSMEAEVVTLLTRALLSTFDQKGVLDAVGTAQNTGLFKKYQARAIAIVEYEIRQIEMYAQKRRSVEISQHAKKTATQKTEEHPKLGNAVAAPVPITQQDVYVFVKIWKHSGGGNPPRENHVAMDGFGVLTEHNFNLKLAKGGVLATSGPHAVNLPPEEAINCHCVVIEKAFLVSPAHAQAIMNMSLSTGGYKDVLWGGGVNTKPKGKAVVAKASTAQPPAVKAPKISPTPKPLVVDTGIENIPLVSEPIPPPPQKLAPTAGQVKPSQKPPINVDAPEGSLAYDWAMKGKVWNPHTSKFVTATAPVSINGVPVKDIKKQQKAAAAKPIGERVNVEGEEGGTTHFMALEGKVWDAKKKWYVKADGPVYFNGMKVWSPDGAPALPEKIAPAPKAKPAPKPAAAAKGKAVDEPREEWVPKLKKWEKELEKNVGHYNAVAEWKRSGYTLMRAIDRGDSDESIIKIIMEKGYTWPINEANAKSYLESAKKWHKDLAGALKTAPITFAKLYRGVTYTDNAVVGSKFAVGSWSSYTSNYAKAEEFAGGLTSAQGEKPTIYEVESHKGGPRMSQMDREDEVLMKKGRKFVVTGVKEIDFSRSRSGKAVYITIKEL
jgi:hypothetical protein